MTKLGFFEELKQCLIRNEKEILHKLIPYYETLLQNESLLGEILADYDRYYFNYSYCSPHDDDYYSDGYIRIYVCKDEDCDKYLNYSYKINLLHDERMWGYCECEPEYKGYDPIHRCVGNGCDYTFPKVSITKETDIMHKSFDGIARDLWELEKKWNDHLHEHNEKAKKQELDRINESIKSLEQQKLNLLN